MLDKGAVEGNNIQQVRRGKDYGSLWWQLSSLLSVFYQDLKVVYLNYANHLWSKLFYWHYMPNCSSASPLMMRWMVRSDEKCTWQCTFENQEHNTYSDVRRIYVAKLIVFTGSQPHTVFFVWQYIFVPVKGHVGWLEISSLLDCILCQVVLRLLDPDNESATTPWIVKNYLPNNMA